MSIIVNGKPLDEYIREQAREGEIIENATGTMVKGNTRTNFHCTTMVGVTDIVLTDNASLVVNRGGKRFELKGDRIEKRDGKWYVDGKAVNMDEPGEWRGGCDDSITIYGDVKTLKTNSGQIKVQGNCNMVNTTSGDVECSSAVNVSTVSGDVTCGRVEGNVGTVSGDIYKNGLREDNGDPLNGYTKNFRSVGNTKVCTLCKTFCDANILAVEVGTTGFKGGDSGYGGRTIFSIRDDAGTDMACTVSDGGGDVYKARGIHRVQITLGGDSELRTFIQALEFAVNALKSQTYGDED